tara:strand:+ start:2617 stop:4452 length:1836 start_codon:yes stop_codon:yes gene_type:complete
MSYRKKFFNGIILLLIVIFCSYIWNYIKIPFNSDKEAIGALSKLKLNNFNDTLRYLIFMGLPFIFYFFLILKNYKNDFVKKGYYFKKKVEISKSNFEFKDIKLIFLLLFLLVIIEFLSLQTPNKDFLDSLHDGDFLTPGLNYLLTDQFWQSSFTVHGGSNIFYTLISWKLLGAQTIGAYELFMSLLTLTLKMFSIIFIFYILKFTKLETNFKILFFTILSLIVLTFSSYNATNYLSIRDLYVFIFFIFFIQSFYQKEKTFLNFLMSLIAVSTIFLHIDIGFYLIATLFLYKTYLFISKRYKDFYQILFFLILSFLMFFLFFGKSEIISFFDHLKHIVFNIDKIHGLEYPKPFFSIGDEADGSRATRVITLQLISGLIIMSVIFLKNEYFNLNEKLFFIFMYFYCFISFKNALGRSDGPHIMQSSDWQSIIIYFFVIHFIFFYFKKNKFFKIIKKSSINLSILIITITILFNININNVINFKDRFLKSINAADSEYLVDDRLMMVNLIKKEIKDENCIQNFTEDLILPYLIKKPTCNKYFSSWLASGYKIELKYINQLKVNKVKYILYESPGFMVIDNISTPDRLKYVNKYILNNYEEVFNLNGYKLVKIKN